MLTIIQNYSLADIKNSISYLLQKSALDEGVRQLAVNISHNKPNPIAAVYDWIKANVNYVRDPVRDGNEIELFISPARMVSDYSKGIPCAGDCDDLALLAVALYRSIGIKSNVVILDTRGQGLDHAVAQAYSDIAKKYIIVDSASQYPLGWEEEYFNKVEV